MALWMLWVLSLDRISSVNLQKKIFEDIYIFSPYRYFLCLEKNDPSVICQSKLEFPLHKDAETDHVDLEKKDASIIYWIDVVALNLIPALKRIKMNVCFLGME